MKVILIHYRLMQFGGLERRLLSYIHWFSENGYQVEVWVAKKEAGIVLPKGALLRILSPGLTLKPFRKWRFHKSVKRELLRTSADFVLSLGRQYTTHAVLDPGNHLAYVSEMGIRWKSLRDRLSLAMDREIFQDARLILAASEYIREFTLKYGVREDKVKVLNPPLELSSFNTRYRKQRNQLREQEGIPKEQKVFLFVSVAHQRKGLDILLKAFNRLKDPKIRLLVAGKKIPSKTPPNVQGIGYQKDMAKWYTLADFCIHPARMEPFGQVIAESLACGTPVIISSHTGAKEIVKPDYGIVVDSLDPGEWERAILASMEKEFSIPDNFGETLGLNLDTHMQKMLSFWDSIVSKPEI